VLRRVRQEVPVGLVDLLDARAHASGERERGHAGGDRERRVRVAERVRRPVLEPRGTDRRRPLVAPPGVQVEVLA
jgi:hypothetical protein